MMGPMRAMGTKQSYREDDSGMGKVQSAMSYLGLGICKTGRFSRAFIEEGG
jgi:hypothetical protein